jgi:hypothetical protein
MKDANEGKQGLSLKVVKHISKDSISASVLFCLLLIVLHFLEPEYNPLVNLVSEYELGKYGWMMSLAFFSLASAVLAMLAATLNKKFNTRGKIGRILFSIIFIALLGAGIFYPFTGTSTESAIHTTCGMIVIIGFPIAAFLFRKNVIENAKNIIKVKKLINWATLCTLIGFLSFMGSIIVLGIISGTKENLVIGIQNRFMMLAYSIWIIAVSWEIAISKEK